MTEQLVAVNSKYCVGCATPLHSSALSCPKCGAVQNGVVNSASNNSSTVNQNKASDQKYCNQCGKVIHQSAPLCPACGAQQVDIVTHSTKSRTTAMILAFFLGGIGGHKFYLGQTGQGVLYLLFCWTFIPAILAIIDIISLATMKDHVFAVRYA